LSHNHSFQTRPSPRPGFRVLTGSLGRSGQFFFINQNNIVLVKKQKQKLTGCNRVFDWFLPGQPAGPHRVFYSFIFSSIRPNSSPGSIGSRVNPSSRAEFQNYAQTHWLKLLTSTIRHPLQNVNLNYSIFFLKKKINKRRHCLQFKLGSINWIFVNC
jgi:hypothetical protein